MNKWKKAISVGMSAALLASLFTVSAASTVLAANSSSGGGTIIPGGAASAAGTITFAEDNTAQPFNQFSNGSFTLQVLDFAGGNTISFSTAATPTVTVNSGVGAATAAFSTTGIANDTLIVSISGTDTTKLDSFTIGNLKVKATVAAALGAVKFTVLVNGIGLSQSLVTASGVLAADLIPPASAAVTLDTGSPGFQPTSTACTGGALSASKVTIAAKGVSVAETFTAAAGTTGGTITYAVGAVTVTHPAGAVVTQSVCANMFPSFVTVGDAIKAYLDGSTETFNAGVSRQDADDVCARLGFADGLVAKSATVTFTIATAGVTFSTNFNTIEDWWTSIGGLVTGNPTLSADLKTLTFTMKVASLAGNEICIDPDYDVAAGVPNGTAVDVNVASGTITVTGNPVTVAYVGNLVVGVTSVPNVIIAMTNQSAGVITLTESGPASFTDSASIEVCLDSPTAGASWSNGTYFWAVVTKGDLKLNVGGLPVTQGLLAFDGPYCLEILDYTESTVASTIEIHTGSATAPAAGGPRINVWNNASPGPIFVNVYSDGDTVASNVVIAMAVFGGSPSAAAVSQPVIYPGLLGQAGGNITITEGFPGAFQNGDYYSLCVVNLAKNQNTQVTWSNPQGVNAPVVTTNSSASGLIAHYYSWSSGTNCLTIRVDSSSLVTLGVITISNLKFDVVPDAGLGPVFIHVFNNANNNISSAGRALDQYVSNATVGVPVSLTSGSALGVSSGPFSAATKIAALNKYVTFRFSGGAALAGKRVEIWVATKNANGTWGAFVKVTARYADASGNADYYVRSSTAKWISVMGDRKSVV